MANYLVSDTNLTSIANAIRTKGETSGGLTFPDGFVSAINAIDGGGGGGGPVLINYVTRFYNMFLSRTDLPQKISISPVKLDSGNNNGYFLYRAYESGKNTATLEVELTFNQTTSFSLKQLFLQAYGLYSVKISGNLQYVTSYDSMFNYCLGVREIDMVIDFTSCASDADCSLCNAGNDNTYVTSLAFVPNTASYSVNISKFSALNSASLISAANCLNANVSGKSLALHATPKAACATIMGTNNNGTFEADAQGTMTLQDFITTVKGWTLA